MSGFRLALLASALASTGAWAQKAIEYKLGTWTVTYRAYPSAAAVCDTEPQWLYEELEQVNGFLDSFLARASTRNGAWGDEQLPMLEEALKTLPALVAAHERSVTGLAGCSFSRTGLYPQLLVKSDKLVKEAQTELGRMPELVRFARHRAAVERWEKERAGRVEKAKESCKDAPAKPPRIYFAFQDEYATREYLFCDGAVVRAPASQPLEIDPGDSPAKDPEQAKSYFWAARSYVEHVMKAPQQF